MSTVTTKTNALDALLAQYDGNNKPKYEKREGAKTYDLKNYFNTFIEDKDVNSITKEIRVIPMPDGSSPLIEMWGHKMKLDGQSKTFPCLKHEKDTDCPFCEANEALYASGTEADKELAKKYKARMYYIVKVIDRANEADGVKFWRFPHDFRKEGIFDKITGVLKAIKKDITDPVTGRDLSITVNRNQNKVPVVSSIVSMDPTPLSTDPEQAKAWLEDSRTWEDVYSVRNYEYLEIIVKGGTPVWDEDLKKMVDKASKTVVESDNLDAELTLGVQNVKSNVTAAAPSIVVAPATANVEEDDDLPF